MKNQPLFLLVMLLSSPLFGISQDLRERFPQTYPPHDYGIDRLSLTGNDLADSVARMAVDGTMFYPEMLLGKEKRYMREQFQLWLKEGEFPKAILRSYLVDTNNFQSICFSL